MKKQLLASTLVAVFATTAHAAPTVYGKAMISFDLANNTTENTTTTTDATGVATTAKTKLPTVQGRPQMNSVGRIGFKGSEAISAETDIIYKLEYGTSLDFARSPAFVARDTYLGLANKELGTIMAGRLSAIDDKVDYANVTAGGVAGGDGIIGNIIIPRSNNAIGYTSPNINGITLHGMYVMDENKSTDSLGRDGFGVAMTYEPINTPYRGGLSYLQTGKVKTVRLSGDYQISPEISAGALYQNISADKSIPSENTLTISGSYNIAQSPWTAYAQADIANNLGGNKNNHAKRLVVGSKYKVSKNSTAHFYGAYLNENGSTIVKDNTTQSNSNTMGIGAGLEYKF